MDISLFSHNGQRREHDVENRRVFSFDKSQLCLYETFRPAHEVQLFFPNPVLATMLAGKKVMSSAAGSADFLPGESIVYNSTAHMRIMFPEAQEQNPTRCLTLEIEPALIKSTVTQILEVDPGFESDIKPVVNQENIHFKHNPDLVPTLERFLQIHLVEKGAFGQALANHTLRELILRLFQSQARTVLLGSHSVAGSNRMAAVAQFVRDHIHEPLDATQLANLACLSKPQFFKRFRQLFGTTPNEFVINEKLAAACRMLREPGVKVVSVAYSLSFSTPQYFIRLFRSRKGITPSQYQRQLQAF